MHKLVISTPWYKKDEKTGKPSGRPGQPSSWETYMNTGKGLGYILTDYEYYILSSVMRKEPIQLVMLRNDKDKKRAEAWLKDLVQTEDRTRQGWRYDVYFEKQTETPYKYLSSEKLKLNGVKVI